MRKYFTTIHCQYSWSKSDAHECLPTCASSDKPCVVTYNYQLAVKRPARPEVDGTVLRWREETSRASAEEEEGQPWLMKIGNTSS